MQPPDASPYVPETAGAPRAAAPKASVGAGMITCLSVVGAVVVALVVLAVYAFVSIGKFNDSMKVVGARSHIATIAHAQLKAFTATGKLCNSAPPVPADIPKRAYTPSKTPGEDFLRGSSTDGWICLGWDHTAPIRYRYEVRVGGGYKAPARGGPDPGPDGFEVSAEGDLDGDGKTSLLVQTGSVDTKTNTLVIESEVIAFDEDE